MASKEEMVAQMHYSADYEYIWRHSSAAITIRIDSEFEDWKELTQLLRGPEGEHVKHVSLQLLDYSFHRRSTSKEFIELAASRMTSLQLCGSGKEGLSNEIIDWLSEAIKSSDCTLKTLELHSCMDMEGAKRLAESGLFNHIERLLIYGYLLYDLTCFVEPLRNPECKIWELGLYLPSFDWLADVVNGCGLRKLAMKFYNVCETSGLPVKLIEALKKPDCKVEGLELENIANFGEEARRNLAECLRDSTSLWFFQVTTGMDGMYDTYAEAIENSRLTHFLLLYSRYWDVKLDRSWLSLLRNPDCKLQSLCCHWEKPEKLLTEQLLEFQADALKEIEANYRSQIVTLSIGPWQSERLKSRCARLLYRNSCNTLFTKVDDKGEREAFQPPSVARLFMCGHFGSGKTTIATNLFRKYSYYPKFLQKHPSTQGIVLRTLPFGNKKLVIYDLAGQQTYHAFHHCFMSRSDKDFFLVVCKVEQGDEEQKKNFKRLLRYWLRFISSHQSATGTTTLQPKVLIALNYFCKDKIEEYAMAARDVADEYKDVLDLKSKEHIFLIKALHPKELLQLKECLESRLDLVLKQLPHIPWTCETVIRWAQGHRVCKQPLWRRCIQGQTLPEPVTQLQEIGKLFKNAEAMDAAKFTLICLEDMGEVIYHGADEINQDEKDQTEKELLEYHTIIDVQWFVEDLIGAFIPQLERSDVTNPCHDDKLGMMTTTPVQKLLEKSKKKSINIKEEDIKILLKLLHQMGVIIPNDANWNGKWSGRLPETIIVPTLLAAKFSGWPQEDEEGIWGRRLECQNKNCTLLPSGVFSKIQMKVIELCKLYGTESYEIGNGWVTLTENKIRVLVMVGGDNDEWTDRQRVDIVIKVLKSNDPNTRIFKAEELLVDMRKCVEMMCMDCPFLKLEESVMSPECLKTIIQPQRQGVKEKVYCKLLLDIKKKATEQGLDYCHTWPNNTDTAVGELLVPSELQMLMHTRKDILDDYETYIAPIYNKPLKVHLLPDFDNEDSKKLAEFMLRVIQEELKEVKVGLDNIVDALKKIEAKMSEYGRKILDNVTEILHELNVGCPKAPYVMEKEDRHVVFDYKKLGFSTLTINYMCEGQMFHPINGYPGVDIKIVPKWFPALVPVVNFFFFAAKMGSTAAPIGGELIKKGLEYFGDKTMRKMNDSLKVHGLRSALIACFGPDFDPYRMPSKEETTTSIKELFSHIKSCQDGKNEKVFMPEKFGLHYNAKKDAWLCEHHNHQANSLVTFH